ncbi:MAG TPA: glutamate--cysteine ligase [Jatrophihabitantaceae bacterium]
MGVEEELLLFTSGGQRPAPAGEELAEDPDLDVEHEFKLEQAEIASEPADSADRIASDLRMRRRELIDGARERDVLVAALGTSPVGTRPTATPDERYQRMHERFGLVAGDQLTCGAHVHVGVSSRGEGIVAINGVRRWLAVLLAMTSNSPFWSGADTGYASYRNVSWGRWPTAGPTTAFTDPDDYDRVVAGLVAAGAAVDDGMIYFDARLSAKYPTVEIRVADVAQHVEDSAVLGALCRALVDTAVAAEQPDVPVAMLRAASWRAARYGLTGDLLDPVDLRPRSAANVIDRLLDTVRLALRTNDDDQLVARTVDRLLREGTGAELQRADLARSDRAHDVVRAAVARTAE